MSITSKQDRSDWRRVALAGVVAGAMSLAATIANAGECPADKKVADGQGQKPSTAAAKDDRCGARRSEEHTSELQSPCNLVCRLLLEKKKQNTVTESIASFPIRIASSRTK